MRSIPEAFITGAQMRQARETHKLSQLELAQYLGVSRNTVNRIEAGGMILQHHTALHAALLFLYLGQSEAFTAPSPARVRPYTLKSNERPTQLRTFAGERITRAEIAQLPVYGRWLERTSAGDGIHITDADPWHVMEKGQNGQPILIGEWDMELGAFKLP